MWLLRCLLSPVMGFSLVFVFVVVFFRECDLFSDVSLLFYFSFVYTSSFSGFVSHLIFDFPVCVAFLYRVGVCCDVVFVLSLYCVLFVFRLCGVL